MNRSQIETIESAVTVHQVLDSHGIRTSRKRCRCPFHKSRPDTMSITDKLFHCFSCGASGGVIQLEAKLSGITDDEACRVLADRYGLDISVKPLTAEDKENYKLECRINSDYEDYQNEKKHYYSRMSVLFRNIRAVPELYDTAKDLRDWLDDNINGVEQEWNYQGMI